MDRRAAAAAADLFVADLGTAVVFTTGDVFPVVTESSTVPSVLKNDLALSALAQLPKTLRTWSRAFAINQLRQKGSRIGCARRQAAEEEVTVFVSVAEVAEELAVLVLPKVMVSVAVPPPLIVTSDTTTTAVDVLSKVSLDTEGRVGRFVVDKMVEVFAGVNVLEGRNDVTEVDEQRLVVLKPKFPIAKSQILRLGRDAADAISESAVNVGLGVRLMTLRNGDVVPIWLLFKGSRHQ